MTTASKTKEEANEPRSVPVQRKEKQRAVRKKPTLLVGIDLGTSHSAIVSSKGDRILTSTYIGKPKDSVAEKVFGKRLLFGDEALNNRLSVDLYRPLEKGVVKSTPEDLDAANAIIKHLISLLSPTGNEVIYGVIGTPAQASIRDRKTLIEVTKGVLDAVLVVSEPFSVAYGLNILTDALVIDIGAGTIDLCRMHGTLPTQEDQVTINKAGDFIDKALFDLLKTKYPEAQFSINMIKRIKERYGFMSEKFEQIEVELPVRGKPVKFDVTAELRTAALQIIPDLTEAIYSLISSFDPEFQKRLRERVIIAGEGSQMTGIGLLIERALDELGGGNVTIVEEASFAGANGALLIAKEAPPSFWEHL